MVRPGRWLRPARELHGGEARYPRLRSVRNVISYAYAAECGITKLIVILSEAKNLSLIAAIEERFFASLRMTTDVSARIDVNLCWHGRSYPAGACTAGTKQVSLIGPGRKAARKFGRVQQF